MQTRSIPLAGVPAAVHSTETRSPAVNTLEYLRRVALFRDLPESDLSALAEQSTEVSLTDGEMLFREGESGDAAYVIVSGNIEIVKAGSQKETLLALRMPGEVIGEMALLQDEPRMASARGRGDTVLLKVPQPAMVELMASSPTAIRGLFDIILDRLRSTEGQLRQNERMVQLGTLTAGVAHELNNPAAAVSRAASQLDDAVKRYVSATASSAPVLDAATLAWIHERVHQPRESMPIGALERADLEEQMEDALSRIGMTEPWKLVPDLVDAGIRQEDLAALGSPDLVAALDLIGTGRAVESLIASLLEGSDRLSAIVGALKSYSFLDQAPVQEVDVTQGIEDTILILGEKLKDITIERDYEAHLNRIEVQGSELNQVWTNLLDNAGDAITERRSREGASSADRILIRTANAGEGIVVEITDNGSGIAPEHLPRVFDSFFTTKEPGQGTGLGLDISHRIVVMGHRGDLTVDSEPGRTTFRVELPGQ